MTIEISGTNVDEYDITPASYQRVEFRTADGGTAVHHFLNATDEQIAEFIKAAGGFKPITIYPMQCDKVKYIF